MIVVFGGTTEGKQVARFLEEKELAYLYSTKTEVEPFVMVHGEYRFGALDERGMEHLFRQRNVTAVIDAAHPFASLLHETVSDVCLRFSIPVIRFERIYDLPREAAYSKNIYYSGSFPEAIDLLRFLKPKRVLAMTGVQTIDALRPYWKEHEMRVRILPSGKSVMHAQKQGFPLGNLILHKPSGFLEDERRIIRAYGIDCLLVKESGNSGFLPVKITAAMLCGIPVVIVKRPNLPDSFITVTKRSELNRELERISKLHHAGE
ncbi:precorrin-6A reductase [Prosthecochloris sp. SCSIO W1101]|uniref:precorrin-6A reductase n=1 Tax=Prosthecochloris sp. SCSIO W1101 TaxID=2992242 RepID=UPI00223E4EDA|nr:precorrin-6A reductase [Prosthecochloris sp. SCSIO W1101]UZJ40191.1 precorrin-6A reductase [Prosthecochloris sp. SCSIO W1101]